MADKRRHNMIVCLLGCTETYSAGTISFLLAALQLDNSVRGIENRLNLAEQLIQQAGEAEFIVLPELSTPGYIPTYDIWNYKEANGAITKDWAAFMAKKYNIYIGCGYHDYSEGEYYNAYLIAGPDGICGTVYKEEPESNIFKRGRTFHSIETPLGKIAVGICFDCHRKCFYEEIKTVNPVLILMPHAWAMSVNGDGSVKQENLMKIDFLCNTYAEAFRVPVVFCNALWKTEGMAGITGALMKDYKLAGQSAAALPGSAAIHFGKQEVCSFSADITKAGKLHQEIPFFGTYIDKGSRLFRNVVIPQDIRKGVRDYERHKPLSFTHFSGIAELWADEEVIKYTNIKSPCSMEESRKRMEVFLDNQKDLEIPTIFAVLKEGAVCGMAGCLKTPENLAFSIK